MTPANRRERRKQHWLCIWRTVKLLVDHCAFHGAGIWPRLDGRFAAFAHGIKTPATGAGRGKNK